jgi:hypothetical protein
MDGGPQSVPRPIYRNSGRCAEIKKRCPVNRGERGGAIHYAGKQIFRRECSVFVFGSSYLPFDLDPTSSCNRISLMSKGARHSCILRRSIA